VPVTLQTSRSLLFCPGNRLEVIAKTPRSAPDAIVIDLEDAVAPPEKPDARATATSGAAALAQIGSSSLRLLRVNGPETPWHEDDLVQLREDAWQGVVVPKVEDPAQLRLVRRRLAGLGRPELAVLAGLETAAGVAEARALAAVADAVYFGAEDFITDLGGVRTPGNLEVLYARSAVVLAARLGDAPALDQIVADHGDSERFRREAEEARSLGYTGKLCIHPGQVPLANAAFLPTAEEVDRARRLVAAYEAAAAERRGAIDFEGEMVDRPLYLRALTLLQRASAHERAGAGGPR
jgi:citrate lyase subunit beta/citryl-CoA lyase